MSSLKYWLWLTSRRHMDSLSALTVLDPVMGDHGRPYSRITPEHVKAMKQLCGKANVLLPNVTEAALLTGASWLHLPLCGRDR